MLNPPNRTHSILVNDMCERLQLTDPFRLLYPNKKEFTFVPSSSDAINRSRLDYFLVSHDIIENGLCCSIEPGLQNKLFDHRACRLELGRRALPPRRNSPVDTSILNHDVTDYIVFAATAEAYAVHAANDELPAADQRGILRNIGDLKQLIRLIGSPVVPPEELVRDGGGKLH
jgi:hypothetical protein